MMTLLSKFTSKKTSPLLWFILLLFVIAGVTTLGPAERSLGTNVRVVYLHGAWVWAALISFAVAALVGGVALLLKNDAFHRWSHAAGRTGLFFWITYLPISLWAMQTNWNGLFLAEPRWRLAVVFSVGGLVMQLGILLMGEFRWASVANLLFFGALVFALGRTDQVMHPDSPVADADSWRIQAFFYSLVLITLLAASQMARWWHRVSVRA